MNLIKRILTLLWIGLIAGCSSGGGMSYTLCEREVVLSPQHQEDEFLKARVVAIAADGTTSIKEIPSGEVLRAAPGAYFTSTEFGGHGLQLVSASAEKHEARFMVRWCDTK